MSDPDGRGLTGKGLMTRTYSGSCILRIPDNQDEPIQGFTGEPEWLLSFGGKADKKKGSIRHDGGDRT
jgi:hypothetical protein